MNTQPSFFDDIIVDSFAGGGGASTGIEQATGRIIDIAINHDESAILMHKRNHPNTEHYREDVWKVDPIIACRGRHVRLAWFSPDCKHFSRAKGAALVDRHIRGLAWIVLRWAGTVRPDVIMLENVPEFVTWGPVRKGHPIKSKAGTTFEKWRGQLEDLGYQIDYRTLCAADFGAPTIRTRFCLVARCDGRPISFPKRTHAPRDSKEVKSGKLKPWRAAAEIIDWSLPCYSIFEKKETIKEQYGVTVMRPLKDNTLRRIARGLDKFVIKNPQPFIMSNNTNNAPHDIDDPVPTITTGDRNYVVKPKMMAFHTHNNSNAVGADMKDPTFTVTGSGQQMLCGAYLTEYFSTGRPLDVKEPMHTITALPREAVVAASLIQYHTENEWAGARGQTLDDPLRTVDASNRYGVSAVYLSKYFTGVDGADVKEPLPTVTAVDHNSIAFAHLAHYKGEDKGQDPQDPLMTVTARDGQFGVIRSEIAAFTDDADLGNWCAVRDLLNRFCDYKLKDDEILLFLIAGVLYFIADIGLRMLAPRELYDAMGFPHDYIIDTDDRGRPISRANQVARCGNAVCPPLSKAMVEANMPEFCDGGAR